MASIHELVAENLKLTTALKKSREYVEMDAR